MTATPLLLPVSGITPGADVMSAPVTPPEGGETGFTGLLNQLFTAETSIPAEVDLLPGAAVSELSVDEEIPVETVLTDEILLLQQGQEPVTNGQELPVTTGALPSPAPLESEPDTPITTLTGEKQPALQDVSAEAIVAVVPLASEVTKHTVVAKLPGARPGGTAADTRDRQAVVANPRSDQGGTEATRTSSPASEFKTESVPLFTFKQILDPGTGIDRFQAVATDARLAQTGSSELNGGIATHMAPSLNKMPPLATPTVSVDRPVGQPGWAEDIGSQIKWMANGKIQGAEMRLNPRHLGPMEVRVTVQNDQTSVTFISPHAAVRDALDAALPRLREIMADSGMQLTQANVGDQASSQQARQNESQGQRLAQGKDHAGANTDAETVLDEATQDLPAHPRLGLVDTFA